MRIMVMADEESAYIWDHYRAGMFDGIDLILSCGDLDPEYLSFVETFANVPLLYVHGNHDDRYDAQPPLGCFCAEDRIYTHNGVRILGLGGSMRYRDGKYQYTEREMRRRVTRLRARMALSGGFDILMTHAPIAGFHDGDDLCHRGFSVFGDLLETYRPRYFIHGHMHLNYADTPRVCRWGDTTVLNAYRTYTFDF